MFCCQKRSSNLKKGGIIWGVFFLPSIFTVCCVKDTHFLVNMDGCPLCERELKLKKKPAIHFTKTLFHFLCVVLEEDYGVLYGKNMASGHHLTHG